MVDKDAERVKVLPCAAFSPRGGGKILSMSGLQRTSLTSCALLLSLSTVAYANPETTTETPSADYEKGYILTPVETQGANTITKYEFNEETNKLEPVYYQVDLAKTEYGEGDTTKYFEWSKDEYDKNYLFGEVNEPTEGKTTITVHYNTPTVSHNRIEVPAGDTTYKDSGIIADFINNTARPRGGAIYNEGSIGNIIGDFIGNSAAISSTYSPSSGGAIYNKGEIGDITGDFIGNSTDSSGISSSGGAIYNDEGGTIGDITGDFIGNYAATTDNEAHSSGGAIYNDEGGTIGDITGDFIGNSTDSSGISSSGGAIYNKGTIGDITGDFIGNYAVTTTRYSSYGGAIYNKGTIGDITGDFIGNYAVNTARYSSSSYGGAIYNDGGGTIGNITGDFIGNSSSFDGGAIYNDGGGTIGNITGDFIGNSSSSGGAIYNKGEIGDITGDFIGNSSSYGDAIYNSGTIGNIVSDFIGDSSSYGDAIYNSGTIGNITGDFIGNSSSSGRAIYNKGEIGDITGDFIGNSSSSGGAIYNSGTIGNIVSDFIGNSTDSSGISSSGGAIYNSGTIGNIVSDFIGNSSSSTMHYESSGGAIYNKGEIGDITGDFIENSSSHISNIYQNVNSLGGAIYNSGTIGNIVGDFIGNSSSSSTGTSLYGGAIYNRGEIGNITGDFIGNYASTSSQKVYGGAIYNIGEIGSLDVEGNLVGGISGSFINNYATTKSTSRLALGGAVYTTKDMNFIANAQTHTISGNYTEDPTRGKVENAIFVATSSSSSPTITFKTEDGGKYLIYDQIEGGTVSGTNISYDYGYNLTLTGDGTGTIGLYNDIINADVKTDNVTVDFVNNETKEYEFVSMSADENTKLNIDVDIVSQTADRITTQEDSSGTIGLNKINFIGQYSGTPITVQILNTQNDDLQLSLLDNIITIPDIGNTVYDDQIIAEAGAIELATTNTTNDSITIKDKIYDALNVITSKSSKDERNFTFRTADKYVLSTDLESAGSGVLNINGLGAANPSTIDANGHTLFNLNDETTLNITNTTIENAKDYAIKAENSSSAINLTNTSIKNTAGTAIASNVDVNLTADNGKSEFSGNTTAINMNDSGKTINITAKNAGEVVLDDEITGTSLYNLKLTGDKTSKVTLNNKVSNANTTLEEVTLHLTKADILASSTLTANSGHLSLMNGIAETQVMQGMNINGHLGMSVDVDLQAAKMDRLPENVVVSPDAQIDVEYLNLLNDAKGDKTDIQFADKSYSNQVSYTGDNEVMYKGTAYSPIYKYDVSYNKDDGFFTFLRGGASSGNASDSFNPSVLSTGVTSQAGAYATQMNTFHYAFQHLDNFMNLPYMERLAIKNQNRYALTSSAESGIFSPTYAENLGASYWIKPYVSFESIPLNNGPKVDNINYGTLIGFDGEMKPIAHGFDRVLSGYVGYNGASQSYSGVDSYQNGGLLGGTMFLYKGNFFNATTLSAGASIGENHNMYGNEDFTMLLAGIGNRLGYNFEFKGGKYIIQPSMLMSYTFVNTFDYTNSAGLNIESDPMHVIQLSPGVKFIMNTRNGWQPYATVNMVWNIMASQKVTANAVRLPEMSVDPYVQYGLGIQKRIKDKFVAFGQALVSNGGRNGVSLTFGLRWFLGKE